MDLTGWFNAAHLLQHLFEAKTDNRICISGPENEVAVLKVLLAFKNGDKIALNCILRTYS